MDPIFENKQNNSINENYLFELRDNKLNNILQNYLKKNEIDNHAINLRKEKRSQFLKNRGFKKLFTNFNDINERLSYINFELNKLRHNKFI